MAEQTPCLKTLSVFAASRSAIAATAGCGKARSCHRRLVG